MFKFLFSFPFFFLSLPDNQFHAPDHSLCELTPGKLIQSAVLCQHLGLEQVGGGGMGTIVSETNLHKLLKGT